MATRSTIALQYEDGKVRQIYCHWDGYVSNNGKILFESYQDVDKITQLIDLGSLSSLGKEIGVKHDFDKSSDEFRDMCTAYGRDRGEEDTDPYEHDSLESYVNNLSNTAEEYNYIFMNGTWMVSSRYPKAFAVLGDIIAQEEQNEKEEK